MTSSGGLAKKYFFENIQNLIVPIERAWNSDEDRAIKHALILFLSKVMSVWSFLMTSSQARLGKTKIAHNFGTSWPNLMFYTCIRIRIRLSFQWFDQIIMNPFLSKIWFLLVFLLIVWPWKTWPYSAKSFCNLSDILNNFHDTLTLSPERGSNSDANTCIKH